MIRSSLIRDHDSEPYFLPAMKETIKTGKGKAMSMYVNVLMSRLEMLILKMYG